MGKRGGQTGQQEPGVSFGFGVKDEQPGCVCVFVEVKWGHRV